ncbi:MAG: M24 family metallopeptidase [Dehalococcoidales bacterium]
MNVNSRLKKLRSKLSEKELDAVFITQADNRRYLSGFHGTAGYLVITAKQAILATDFRYIEQAKAEAPDFKIHRITGSISDWLPALVNDLKIRRLGFEGGNVTHDFHRQLQSALRKAKNAIKLVATNGLVEAIRAIKESEEIEFITKASAITDAAFESVEPKIKSGVTEKQLAWELEKSLRERGSEALPFDIIVGSGPNAALPHAKPSDRVIREGESIVIDMGAKYRGYASDLTRTVCVGKADAKFKEVYNIVLEAQAAAITQIKRGMTGQAVDAFARDVITRASYGEAFGHSLGHGVGLAEHELPYLSPNSKEKLTDNMVFTIEPGIYLEGWGGVRIEDTVVMEKGKVRLLTKARKAEYR